MKKLLLSFALMLMASSAAWADYVVVNGIRFETNEWTDPPSARVMAPEEGAYSGEIVIPSTINYNDVEYKVTGFDYYAFAGSEITKVTIPGSVEVIPSEQFRGCESLTTVVLEKGVKYIEAYAFYHSTALSSVTLPEGLLNIGYCAFESTALTSLTIPSTVTTIESNAFLECASLTSVTFPAGLKKIDSGAFYHCTSLASITLPEGLETIGSNAFVGTAITTLTIPGTVMMIDYNAFAECTSLTSVTFAYSSNIPEGDWPMENGTLWGYDLFSGCTSLTDITMNRDCYFETYGGSPIPYAEHVTLGSHVTFIPPYFLKDVTTLKSLSVGANVTEVSSDAFRGVTFPTGSTFPFSQLKKIGVNAFYYCTNLPATINLSAIEDLGYGAFGSNEDITSVTIGPKVKITESGVFNGCSNLVTLNLSEGLEEIGDYCFSYLSGLTTVSLPSTLKKIGAGAFCNCWNLTLTSNLPEGLTSIGYEAFVNCEKLNTTIPSTLTHIGYSAFNHTVLTEVTIPAGVTEFEGSTFANTKVTSVTIPGTVKKMYDEFGNCNDLTDVRIEYGEVPLFFPGGFGNCKNLYIDRDLDEEAGYYNYMYYVENVTFGPHFTAIPDIMLYSSAYMQTVTMTDNVKKIGNQAFAYAEAQNLTLSNKLESIGDAAFYYFKGLNSFTFPVTVKSIGASAFFMYDPYDGEKMKDVYVPWLTPLTLADDGDSGPMFNYEDYQTLWVPGGTMDAYKNATIWKKFKNFKYWSYVVTADVTGKGTFAVSNGQTVTDNGTNTALSLKGEKLVSEGAGEAVTGLFVREKNLTLTPTPARGYELKTLTANGSAVAATEGVYTVASLSADQAVKVTFTPINYKLTYDLAGGALAEGQENPATYTVEDETITLKNPTRVGYTFEGWTGTGLESASKEVKIAKNSIGDRSYTATWKPIVYNLAYNLAGGTLTTANPTTYTIETATFTLKNPTRKGYTFEGWTGTELTEATKTVTIAKGNIGERSFTATWKVIPYTITYDLAGGALAEGDENPVVYNIETATFTLKNPTRANYEFAGWTGTGLSTATKEVSVAVGSTENRTYTATWKPINYTIAYNLAGGTIGSGQNPVEYNVETATFTLKAPTYEHYDFAGWTGTGLSTPTKEVTITKGSTGERSYTATWTPCIYDVNIEKTGEGTVVASTQKPKYTENVTLTITPDKDYKVSKVMVDGVNVTDNVVDGQYTISYVSADVEVIVEFERKYIMGDVNGDGSISVTDVGMMISYILGNDPTGFNAAAADMNGDDQITVTDVGALITKILQAE